MNRGCSLVVLLVGIAACKSAPTASKAPPVASADRKVTEDDLVRVRLTPEAEARLGITTANATQTTIAHTARRGGEVVVPSGGALFLTSPVAATVASTTKATKSGTAVKRGDLLVTLIPLAPVDRDLRGQSDRATLAAEARFVAATAKLARAEKVLADGAGTQRAVEEARAEHDVAKADLDAARQRASSMITSPLGADVSVTIRAPHDGVVRQVGASPGQSVAAGAMLVEVVGTSALWVRVPIFVGEARRIRRDAAATVFAFGSEEGHVVLPAAAPPVADPLTSTVDLTYELGAPAVFRQGERVEVELTYQDQGPSLVVPASAVVRDAQGGAWVYEAQGAQVFARRRVDVVRVQGDGALLAAGLKAGTPVVRTGAAELWGFELGGGK
ncbi:hypothetical protein BH11MYX4_BH11MYX4_12380 [soil metagenome]